MKVGYDLDDVIIECIPGIYKWLDEPFNGPTHIWTDKFITDNFHRVQYDQDFWMQLRLLNGIDSLTVPPDVFVTHRCIGNELTRRYLDAKGFHGIPVYTVPRHVSKAVKLKELNVTHFIDDKLRTYYDLDEVGITSVLYSPPYHLPSLEELKVDRRVSDMSHFKNFMQ